MVTGLVDSSVLVDVLRGYPPAEQWLADTAQLGVTQIIWLELLEGSQNKQRQREAMKLLRRFALIRLTGDDVQWSIEQLITLRLSHNVDAFDCLIVSVHVRLNLPLYTRNLKHFIPLIGELARSPY
jgi:predicted nucleic acid-binding protein